ncbi:hypothetical protein GCK32_010510 [Trichostrongylus colubriformis]|uniref:Peptidase M13 N-terminal domain-containing protein n=1 Tax=Trichostrongylus colubriformis TaxID=6319 RepID=A0AAN8EPZ5_TRICO
MLAMYARSQHTEVLRPMAEEMVRAIITAFKNEIQENRWMEKSFKEQQSDRFMIGGSDLERKEQKNGSRFFLDKNGCDLKRSRFL